VVDRFGPAKAFSGGLRVKTTLDVDLQQAAENAVSTHLSDPNGPAASMVVIDNRTGEVRAMVGGRPGKDYGQAPFNLATQGQRQPGSAFKAFVLAAALRQGVTPDSVWASQQKIFNVPNSGGKEKFVVNNFEGDYAGSRTLADATANSDNSVFAEVGIKVGTRRIARIAHEMGIRTPVSTNPAITLGGLKEGVTPLDMAHAYETLASGGQRVTGTLGSSQNGPVGIREVWDPIAHRTITNQPVLLKAVSRKLAETETEVLKGVVCCGTGKEASTGAFAAGKTGTTENFGDAWFVGFNKRWTVAVWVGYPDSLKPMRFDFGGSPVIGGSYPAQIWHDFILAADGIVDQRLTDKAAREGKTYTPDQSASSSGGTGGGGTDTTGGGGGSGSGGSGAGSGTGAGTRAPSGGGGTSRGAPSGGGGGAPSGGGGGAPSGGGGGASGGTGAGGGSAAPTG
jgi:penicillin-binding protein 1A